MVTHQSPKALFSSKRESSPGGPREKHLIRAVCSVAALAVTSGLRKKKKKKKREGRQVKVFVRAGASGLGHVMVKSA